MSSMPLKGAECPLFIGSEPELLPAELSYKGEYSVSMWKYQNGILSNNSDWIGEFCSSCDDIDDENEADDARNSFVDENFQSIKDGNPSEEILGALRNGLYEL